MSGIFGGLNVSASGMTAERLRMDVIAENLANADTTKGTDGQPYRRKEVVLQQAGGNGGTFADALNGVDVVGITQDMSPLKRVYDPGNPAADKQGYVSMPNVEPVTEMVDLITASRGYEANVQALQASKTMFNRTLDILR
jgi:flagellar basal-body rod protein FlgC